MQQRYAVIKGGEVVNVIIAEPGFALPDAVLIPDDAGAACIGAAWDGKRFQRPEPPAEVQSAERRPSIEERLAALEQAILR